MWAAILAIIPWINDIISYFQNKSAEQTAADNSETSAESDHNDDGAQSVAGVVSDNAQNQALDGIENQLDNPTPVVVTKGT